MEQAGAGHGDESVPEGEAEGERVDEGGDDVRDESDVQERTLADDGLVRPDEVYYSKALGRRMSYAEMVEDMDDDIVPRTLEELELLLFCFDAEVVAA